MPQAVEIQERRTSADVVYDHLRDEIISLRLLPGAKISEAEIAAKFGISRQPVRDAFSRLCNLDLLLIQPQKATVVKKFSRSAIAAERFVRRAVELEVAHLAIQHWDPSYLAEFEASLDAQRTAIAAHDIDAFHTLDYKFHELICRVAKAEFAFEVIVEKKAQVDRLCVLSLARDASMDEIISDHERIVESLKSGSEPGLLEAIRTHLSRLDPTIEQIERDHGSFFED